VLFKNIQRLPEESRLSQTLKGGARPKRESLIFGIFLEFGILSYSGIGGVDWKFLQTEF
jgi:hypothetical protein